MDVIRQDHIPTLALPPSKSSRLGLRAGWQAAAEWWRMRMIMIMIMIMVMIMKFDSNSVYYARAALIQFTSADAPQWQGPGARPLLAVPRPNGRLSDEYLTRGRKACGPAITRSEARPDRPPFFRLRRLRLRALACCRSIYSCGIGMEPSEGDERHPASMSVLVVLTSATSVNHIDYPGVAPL